MGSRLGVISCAFRCVRYYQVAVLGGRNLIEHYVSRPADDVSQIHGNIYLGRVQNVLPGMEAAFVDIATPKNAVLYRVTFNTTLKTLRVMETTLVSSRF